LVQLRDGRHRLDRATSQGCWIRTANDFNLAMVQHMELGEEEGKTVRVAVLHQDSCADVIVTLGAAPFALQRPRRRATLT